MSKRIEKEIRDFCVAKNISIKDGMINSEDRGKIQDYIVKIKERERRNTRHHEQLVNCSPKFIIGQVMNGLVGKILFSPIEKYLVEALKREGMDEGVERQYPIGKYKIDIAYPKFNLAIECDGHEYHKGDIRQIEHDQRRDKYLARKGWRTLRFSGIQIRRNINSCIDKIKLYRPPTDEEADVYKKAIEGRT